VSHGINHWTQASDEDLSFSILSDFLADVETRMELLSISRSVLAQRLDVTPSAVTQALDGEAANPTVQTLVKYAKAVGLKVALVCYDDSDPANNLGPVYAGIFAKSWEKCGKPRDLFEEPQEEIMEGYLGEFPVGVVDTTDKDEAISWAMTYIGSYGQIDGGHHKQWVLDQVARILMGTPVTVTVAKWANGQEEKRWITGEPSQQYKDWVQQMRFDEEGEEYGYNEGIAP